MAQRSLDSRSKSATANPAAALGTVAPSVQNQKVFRWWDYPLFGCLSVVSLATIYFTLTYWFSIADWTLHPGGCVLLTVILLVVLANNQGRWYLLPFMRKPVPMTPAPGWKVAVATTIVPHAESLEMLRETVNAIVALDYPHDSWVLDEDDDPRVKQLCAELGVNYFTRKNLARYQAAVGAYRSGTKYGNYNAWLHEIGYRKYDIVTTFDPDHLPLKTFLTTVLGYFSDSTVGYVQAPQAYYNQNSSFIARGAAEETYAYYSSIQMAGHGLGYPVIVGSHNSHRMAALKEVGGFPAHDAEDLLLTLRYRANDWRGVYVPEVLARGLTPVDWSGYLRQQRRWSRSVLDIKLRQYHLVSRNFSLKTRILSLMHGLNYLHRALIALMTYLLLTYMLLAGTSPTLVSRVTVGYLGILFAVLQLCELYRQRFYLDFRRECGFHWRVALVQYAKWPWFLAAFVDVLRNNGRSYELTPKIKESIGKRWLLGPNLGIIAVLSWVWLTGQPMAERDVTVVVLLVAIVMIGASAILIWTEFWRFPAPYDPDSMKKYLAMMERPRPNDD